MKNERKSIPRFLLTFFNLLSSEIVNTLLLFLVFSENFLNTQNFLNNAEPESGFCKLFNRPVMALHVRTLEVLKLI